MSTEIDTPAVIVKDLYKSFRLPNEDSNGIKQLLVNRLKGKKGYEQQHVLNGVSFEIKKGEFFGIVGRNGSGKSTLLKLLAGIYVPDKGLVEVNGSLAPFIELGVGFNPELTGRENVFLNGALLGFSKQEMLDMYDDIVEFAEIEKFMDQKLKNYSSGMQVRLAFSIAIRAKSDILVLDEVLAVGDAAFQQKCYNYFESLKRDNKTVVLVTHDMSAVKQFCDRALMLESGKVKSIGVPYEVSLDYEKANFSHDTKQKKAAQPMPIDILDSSMKTTDRFEFGSEINLSISWPKSLDVHIVGFVVTKNGEHVFGTNTIGQQVDLKNRSAKLKLKPELGDGRYKITAGLFGKTRHDVIEFIDGPEFTIFNQPTTDTDGKEWHGITHIENEWR
jgi:ABC-2 type transport system ATP-binding protein